VVLSYRAVSGCFEVAGVFLLLFGDHAKGGFLRLDGFLEGGGQMLEIRFCWFDGIMRE
jgi:hypothetical protein